MPEMLYVGLQDDDEVAVFALDGDSGTLTKQTEVAAAGGPSVTAISPDRNTLYVGCSGGDVEDLSAAGKNGQNHRRGAIRGARLQFAWWPGEQVRKADRGSRQQLHAQSNRAAAQGDDRD